MINILHHHLSKPVLILNLLMISVTHGQHTIISSNLELHKITADTPKAFASDQQSKNGMPRAYSIRETGKLPPPGNQKSSNRWGYQNSSQACVAWAITYGLLSYITPGGSENPKNPIFTYHYGIKDLAEDRGLKDAGCGFQLAFYDISRRGSCGMNDYSNAFSSPTPKVRKLSQDSAEWQVTPYRIARAELVDDVKRQIWIKKPVVGCFNIPPDFGSDASIARVRDQNNNNRSVWNHPAPSPALHAMLVTGYDDDFPQGIGAFEVMNSYGDTFGDHGFVWIPYSFFADTGRSADLATDNPCCVAAFAYSLSPNPESAREVTYKAAVKNGTQEAWVRVQDPDGDINFLLPDGDITRIRAGASLEVSPEIESLNMRSALDAVMGERELQTTVAPIVGSLTRGDTIRTTDLKKLERSDGKVEYWIKGVIER